MKKGFRTIYMAIGGSATNDGGIGMMAALGVNFLDEKGKILKPIGRNLIKIKKIDIANINPLIKKTKFIGICDVDNVLLGENGATFIYGPQKGANGKYKIELEKGMENYAGLLNETFGRNVNSIKGAGAAGGIGAALLTFLNAKLKSGIETVFEIIDFDKLLKDVDLVITGEGRIDGQSACGKVLAGIGKHAKKYNVPVIAIAGSLGTGHKKLYKMGITSMISTVNEIMTLEHAIKNSAKLLDNAAERMFKIIKAGFDIKNKK